MAIKKWSQAPILTSISPTTMFCIIDGADPKNMIISGDAIFGNYISGFRLDEWSQYVVGETEEWILSAKLGKELKDRIDAGFTFVLTKEMVEAVLTGNITSHTHDQYLTSYTETDPTVPSHVKSILSSDITNWNSKEPAISKSIGYAKWTGSAWSFVNETYSLSTHLHAGVYEPVLGNPSSNGYILSSTTAGVRSWIAPYSYTLPVATSSILGGVKVGYTTSGKNYQIQLDASSNAYVNVPWTDTVYSLPIATASVLGGVKIGTNINVDANGVISVTFPSSYVLPTATDAILGGVKLFSSTVQSVVSNSISTVSSRTYGIQLNSSSQAVVNVPWTDTVYTHPSVNHIPTGGSTGQLLQWASAGTAQWWTPNYLTSYTETDPVFTAWYNSLAFKELYANNETELITAWNTFIAGSVSCRINITGPITLTASRTFSISRATESVKSCEIVGIGLPRLITLGQYYLGVNRIILRNLILFRTGNAYPVLDIDGGSVQCYNVSFRYSTGYGTPSSQVSTIGISGLYESGTGAIKLHGCNHVSHTDSSQNSSGNMQPFKIVNSATDGTFAVYVDIQEMNPVNAFLSFSKVLITSTVSIKLKVTGDGTWFYDSAQSMPGNGNITADSEVLKINSYDTLYLKNAGTTTPTSVIGVDANGKIVYATAGSYGLQLGETSSTAYRGDRGKIAYDHSQVAHQSIINGTGLVRANGTTLSYDNNTYLTGNQSITLSGIITGTGTTAITTAIADNALSIAKTSGLQTALDAKMATASYPDLTAIEALAGTSGLLKKTAANTWTLDTNTYLTGITKAQVEAVLTGAITTHTHSYLPLAGGTLSGNLTLSGKDIDLQYADYWGFIKNSLANGGLAFATGNASGVLVTGLRISATGNYVDSLLPLKENGNQVWHAGNDGSGSGLDADFLDGYHASYFQPLLINPITGTGTANYLPKFTGTDTIGNSIISDISGSYVKIGGTVSSNGTSQLLLGSSTLGAMTSYQRGGSYQWLVGIGGSSSTNGVPKSFFGIVEYDTTPRLVIAHTTGNVLIGTASDAGYKLYVNGTAYFNGNITAQIATLTGCNTQSFIIKDSGSDTRWTVSYNTSTYALEFKNASGVLECSIDQSGNLKAKGEVTAYATI